MAGGISEQMEKLILDFLELHPMKNFGTWYIENGKVNFTLPGTYEDENGRILRH